MLIDPVGNCGQDGFGVAEYHLSAEAEEVDTELFDFLLSLLIPYGSLAVNRTVDLDCQSELTAEEVDNVVAEWLLSVEIITSHLTSLQMLPEENFCQSTVATKLLRTLRQGRVVRKPWTFHQDDSGVWR